MKVLGAWDRTGPQDRRILPQSTSAQRPSLVLQLFKRAVDGSLDSRGPEVEISPFTPIPVGNRNESPQKMSGYQSKAHNYLHAMS